MRISDQTLDKLVEIINEKPIYRNGHKLVQFFNGLGYNDSYGQGFPARGYYTKTRLEEINGTPSMDKCLREIFNPRVYAPNWSLTDEVIKDFNQYLMFDGWQVVRQNTEISFKRSNPDVDELIKSESPNTQEEFLRYDYTIDLNRLRLDGFLETIISARLSEIELCINNNIPLAAIFLTGSTLEGILLSISSKYPKQFNQAKSAPKKDTKVRQFAEWGLKDYIDVAYEIGILRKDVKEFSHVLKSFRNYIHPFAQMNAQFYPDRNTANICFQVLRAAICQVSDFININNV